MYRPCAPSNISAPYETVLRLRSRKSSADLHTQPTNKTIEYVRKEISMCVHVSGQRALVRSHTVQGASCVCAVRVCPVFRPALIAVAGRMPRESPSSSRGPSPPLHPSPLAAISRVSWESSPPLTLGRRQWGALGHVGGVRSGHALKRCPFTSPARSSNVFRRGL